MLRREGLCMVSDDKDIAKHVRSAKTWLEKAEQSFDSQADIKGELNLMLAEAEMKNLRKNHAAGQKLLRIGAALTAVVLAVTVWYASGLHSKAEPITPLTASGKISSENPQWVKTPSLQYENKKTEGVPVQENSGTEETPAMQSTARAPATTDEAVPEPATTEIRQTSAPAQQAVMTDRQVQAAVQDARHSLRGK